MNTEINTPSLSSSDLSSTDEVGVDSGLTDIQQLAQVYREQREREEEQRRQEHLAAIGTFHIDPALLIGPFGSSPKPTAAPLLPAVAIAAPTASDEGSRLLRPSKTLKLTMMAWVGAVAIAMTGVSVASYASEESVASLDASLESSTFEPELVTESPDPSEPPLYVAVAEEPEPEERAPEEEEEEEPVKRKRSPAAKQLRHKAETPVAKAPKRDRGWIDEVVETERPRICDEVLYLVEPDAPECQGLSFDREPEKVAPREPEARPHRLTRSEAMDAMRSISGRVSTCFDRHDFQGIATTHLTIATSGKVSQVRVVDGSEAFQACVTKHVKSLEFPALNQPFSLSYPFVFR